MASFGTFTVAGGAFANETPTFFPLVVSGLTGGVSALTVRINGLTHPDFLFLDLLLVAPDGQTNLLIYGNRSGFGGQITDQNYLFTDDPDYYFPLDFIPLTPSGSTRFDFSASDFGLDIPLVYGSQSSFSAAFNGVDPNGTWKLYVLDPESFSPGGSFVDWSLLVVDNVAPLISTPVDHFQVDSDSSITFSAANGNLPMSSDPDFVNGMNGLIRVEHGTIDRGSGPQKVIGGGGGGNQDVFAFLLENAVYRPDPGFNGVDHITLQASDVSDSSILNYGSLTVTKVIDVEVFDHKTGTSGNDSYTASGYQKIDGGAGKDTITFDFALTQAIVTYDDNTVTIEGPNGTKTVLTGFEKFVFNDGTVDNADGSPLVDDLFYYTRYHDVWAAHFDPDEHYAIFGWHEGRDPNAFFDTNGYLATYADVKAAGVNPLEHYHEFGWKEGRDPSTAFDTGNYLTAYADVNAAHVDPLGHFLIFGTQEGRHAFGDGVWG
jgi:hypothetical protein